MTARAWETCATGSGTSSHEPESAFASVGSKLSQLKSAYISCKKGRERDYISLAMKTCFSLRKVKRRSKV